MLPRAIQEQVDAADALVAQMNGETTPVETPENPDQAHSPETHVQQVSPAPTPEPVSEEKWERKYHTLKGMYDAEVPRLHSQLRELNTQVQTLIAENAAAKAQTPAPTPAPQSTLITEKDKEAFGPDLLDLIERATEAKLTGFRGVEQKLRDEISELKGKLGNVSERQGLSDKDRFFAALAGQVSDWEAVNTDQGFLEWLSVVDQVYGLPRKVALDNAYEALDAARTANIFKQYKATLAPTQTQRQPNQELQRQVAPTRSRQSAPPADSSAKRTFTQGEIAAFYEDWRRGNVDEAQAVQLEKEIHAAIAEGRIR